VGGDVVVERMGVTAEEQRRPAWMLCGAPEGERGDWLVEKLAELGVACFQPVDCARGSWRTGGARRQRWERLAVAALRQSRRSHRMSVEEPVPLEELLTRLPTGGPRWLAEPRGGRPSGVPERGGPAIGLVGPAGGLSEAERAAAIASGFTPIRLSDGRLRTETAAIALAASWSSLGVPGSGGPA
jgi:16S rRNA (uracil1498-N3)-methyltransferase